MLLCQRSSSQFAHNFVVGPTSGMVRYKDLVFHPFVWSHQGAILLKALGGGISVLWTHFFSSQNGKGYLLCSSKTVRAWLFKTNDFVSHQDLTFSNACNNTAFFVCFFFVVKKQKKKKKTISGTNGWSLKVCNIGMCIMVKEHFSIR